MVIDRSIDGAFPLIDQLIKLITRLLMAINRNLEKARDQLINLIN